MKLLLFLCLPFAIHSQNLLRIDHYVQVRSTVPAIAGQSTQIYVREVVQPATLARGPSPARAALFIHGAGTPAEVAFDVPLEDYSWMAFLAREGFDVFSMDMTGYGRSTAPLQMNDPCNLARDQQPAPCEPTYPRHMTHARFRLARYRCRRRSHPCTLRHVEKLSLLGWSQGGPRAGGYALPQHPDKVSESRAPRPRLQPAPRPPRRPP